MTEPTPLPADRIHEYAAQTMEYVKRAVGVPLGFDSDTLPLLDHYLRNVPTDQPATLALVVSTAAAYFGEVIVRRLGGRWETTGGGQITDWRVVLPTGVSFSPAGFVAAAILHGEPEDLDTSLDAPPRMKPYVEQTLARMSPLGEEEFWSLCGRLDTLEHVHEVLVAIAAERLGDAADPDGDEGDGEPARAEVDELDAEPEAEADEPEPPPHVN